MFSMARSQVTSGQSREEDAAGVDERNSTL